MITGLSVSPFIPNDLLAHAVHVGCEGMLRPLDDGAYPLFPFAYTTWENEELSWYDNCYIHAGLNPFLFNDVKGKDVLRMFSDLSVSTFNNFPVGKARHTILCDEAGKVVMDGIVVRRSDDEFITMCLPDPNINLYNSLFISVLFGVAFTILGGLLLSGSIDWKNFLPEAIFGIAVGFAIGMVIPGGKLGFALASKAAKPGTLLFNFVMYTIILIIMLTIMCPVLTLFIGCVIMGAPVAAMLDIRSIYSLYIPFYLIAIVMLMLFGGSLMKLSMKCAGVPPPPPAERAQKT